METIKMTTLNEDFFDLLFIHDAIHSTIDNREYDYKNADNVDNLHLVSNVGYTVTRVVPHFKTIAIATIANDPFITYDYRKEPWKLWNVAHTIKYIPMMPITTVVQCTLRLTESEWEEAKETIKKLSLGISRLVHQPANPIFTVKDAYTFIAYSNDMYLSSNITKKLLNTTNLFSKFYREKENEKFLPTLETFKKRLEEVHFSDILYIE